MDDLLNPNQRRSVAIALRMFEESLRQTDSWLQEAEANGILYRQKLNLPAPQRQEAQQRIAAALEQIAEIVQTLDLEPVLDNPAGLIRGKMSVSWASLIDTQSDNLRRYGQVDPRLKSVLDPAVRQLAQLAFDLASIFDEHDATSG